MKKRILALLAAFSLILPGLARAELKTWEQEMDSPTAFYRLSTWGSELPPVLGEALAQAGYGDLPSLSGAMCEVVEKESQEASGIRALVALQGEDGPVAVGMAYGKDRGQWFLDNMGAKAFLPGRDCTVQVPMGSGPLFSFIFSLDYAEPEGGTVRYLLEDRSSPQRPWVVRGYSAWDRQGQGVEITSTHMEHGFRVRQLPGEDEGIFYPAFVSLIVRYMPGGVGDYPTTQEQARRMAQESMSLFEGKNLALVSGANLREKPTGKSKSLGTVQSGVLARYLGQEPGKEYPWLHLRLGELEGYLSGNYALLLQDVDAFFATPLASMALSSMPPPLARAKGACVLRESPNSTGKELAPLAAGTQMHVLCVTADGYYQVMVPRGEPDWIMDVEGTSGYVKAEEVEVVSGSITE